MLGAGANLKLFVTKMSLNAKENKMLLLYKKDA